MSNTSFSNSSSTKSPENTKDAKIKGLIQNYNKKKNTFTELNFNFLRKFVETSSKVSKEHNQIEDENNKINSKIKNSEESYTKLKQNVENLKHETVFREQNLKTEILSLSNEKDSEISALNDEIKYKTDLCDFFHKLTSAEILECGEKKKVKIRSLKEEMTFSIENDDIEGRLSFELNDFTQNCENLPEWIKTKISFEEELCPTLFYNIYQILNS